MDESSISLNELQRELDYYKKKLDELSGESIRHDYALSSLRYELKQKKEAFSILSNLQTKFSVATSLPALYSKTVNAINTYLGMDRSLVLPVVSEDYTFGAKYWYGFPEEQLAELEKNEIVIPAEVLIPGFFLLLNKTIEPDEICKKIQQFFSINFFVGVPVFYEDKPVAFLLAGRQFEKVPFYQPLNKGDAETLMAIASLISMVLQNKKIVDLRVEMLKQKEENVLVNKMLTELKSTQAKLIQREKMASLGELTAGIAHEIQNPLNFVNNFSEVSIELIQELIEEQNKTQRNLLLENEIIRDIEQNLRMITSHGKRADAIVKSMLQHSRTATGEKQPTDINALADEYIRLSYHGLRAKDKTFNTTLDTHFDESIGLVNVVPQGLGRVLLNLLNNAFYSVSEKSKLLKEHYEPIVTLNTKKLDDKIKISIKDNGLGVQQKVLNKIFQPFFTTKPTGEGTGLGLSLSYDIITKEHGGELIVKTKEGEFAEFAIILPL